MIALEPIKDDDFDTIEDLQSLADQQATPIIICTKKAWNKYESLLFTPEELNGFLAQDGTDRKGTETL
jgi:hypothetical protein